MLFARPMTCGAWQDVTLQRLRDDDFDSARVVSDYNPERIKFRLLKAVVIRAAGPTWAARTLRGGPGSSRRQEPRG